MKSRVRAFEKHDLPAVLALRRKSGKGTEHENEDALARYCAELFFGNPWYDEALPSLVAEDAQQNIVGFLGVIPRPMTVDGAPVRVATTTHFMVDRSAGPLVALELLRTLYRGPQDLSLADVSTAGVRRLWTYLGGLEIPAGTLMWIRPLRAAGHAAAKLGHWRAIAPVARATARVVDAVVGPHLARFGPPKPPVRGQRRAVDDAGLRACLRETGAGRAICGTYDDPSLTWLLGMMARKRWFGTLRRTQVVEERGRAAGWYLCYTRPHGSALLVDLGARAGAAGTVVDHLFDESLALGCTAVAGRFDVRIADEVGTRGALTIATPNGIAAHARDRALLARVAREPTPITRLDGEWWMAF